MITRIDIDDLLHDPTITQEMIDFVLACEQAEIDMKNGVFKPVPPAYLGEMDQREWDKLSDEATASI
ncbi:MAG TPA: hypothetical protein PLK06_02790 [bacterium]|nr:hypothetical protein [bacterium]